jgi:hypothetical protein
VLQRIQVVDRDVLSVPAQNARICMPRFLLLHFALRQGNRRSQSRREAGSFAKMSEHLYAPREKDERFGITVLIEQHLAPDICLNLRRA